MVFETYGKKCFGAKDFVVLAGGPHSEFVFRNYSQFGIRHSLKPHRRILPEQYILFLSFLCKILHQQAPDFL